MRREVETGLSGDVPIVLSQWYDTAKWILEKIDKFPKNQRFIFGQRIAERRRVPLAACPPVFCAGCRGWVPHPF